MSSVARRLAPAVALAACSAAASSARAMRRRPRRRAAPGRSSPRRARAAVDPAAAARWWRLYDDPTLDRLVRRALTENQDLKVAAANLAYAQALLDEARAGLFPDHRPVVGPSYGRSASPVGGRAGSRASLTWARRFRRHL